MRPPAISYRLMLMTALAGACGGCYSDNALIDRVRHDAMRNRLEEIDLGRYSLTMPRNPTTTETIEVEMHLFAAVARYRLREVEAVLERKRYLLRHASLMAIRKSSPDDFTDPDLTALRERLLAATNGLLKESPLQSIGFHDIRFTRQ